MNPNALPYTLGIELEFNATNPSPVEIQSGTPWALKPDGSCGYEVVSPVLRTWEDLDTVNTVCQNFKAASKRGRLGCDARCGFHVHVGFQDVADLALKYRLMRACVHFEDAIFSLADPGRANNQYCLKINSDMVEKLRTGHGWDAWGTRYHWVNAVNLQRKVESKTTLEFRLMRGSFNPGYIRGWACTSSCLVALAALTRIKFPWDGDKGTVDELVQVLSLKELDSVSRCRAMALEWIKAARANPETPIV